MTSSSSVKSWTVQSVRRGSPNSRPKAARDSKNHLRPLVLTLSNLPLSGAPEGGVHSRAKGCRHTVQLLNGMDEEPRRWNEVVLFRHGGSLSFSGSRATRLAVEPGHMEKSQHRSPQYGRSETVRCRSRRTAVAVALGTFPFWWFRQTWPCQARGKAPSARHGGGQLRRLATTLIANATITAPKRYDSKACDSAMRRISLLVRLVSET